MNRHPLESYSAYLDGHCLSDAEVQGLRAWIAADERNATEFVELAILHAAVTERLRLGRLLDDLASHRSGGGITPSLIAEAIREIETNSPRVVVSLPPEELIPAGQPWWQLLAPAAAVAAVLMVGAWGLWQAGEEVVLPKPAQQPIAAAPVGPAPSEIVARLSTSFDAQWAEGAAVSAGHDFVEGASLTLNSGVIKLEMVGGAAVVVEGPSELRLTGSDGLHLNSGKVAVRIGEGSDSFVVGTPTMQVIDLGTEFGVETSDSNDAQVMVFDGSVALAEPASESDGGSAAAVNHVHQLGAGFQASLSGDHALAGDLQAEALANPRHFLRPDEIDVRLRALEGSVADQKLAAHFERQRLEGLLAYQGFDAASSGNDLVLGMNGAGLHAVGTMRFTDESAYGGGIDVQGGPVFLHLDASPSGPFGRAGLVADSGRIGRPGTEVWLTWRTRRLQAVAGETGSAGMSLMFGDRSDTDEPVFFGRGYGDDETVVVQTAWGKSPPPEGERVTAIIDFKLDEADVQEQSVDDADHTWVARVEFRAGSDAVSVWVDPDFETLNPSRPQAMLEVSEIEFDRIRLAVNRSDEVWRYSELAVASNPQVLYQLSHVAEFQVDK